MKPAAFEYSAPDSVDEVVALLAELGDEAKPLAGGQSLTPMLALRLAVVGHLIDLRRVSALRGIEARDDGTWIGAMTTQTTILRAQPVPLVARATPLIGHFQIRNRGTIGGSIAHADAAAEYPAVALALGARIEAVSSRGPRTVPADSFFTGLWSTDLAPDELLTGIVFPSWTGRCGFAIEEFARRHGDYAVAGAAVAVELADDDRVRRSGIALFGLGPSTSHAADAEALVSGALAGELAAADVGAAAMDGLKSVTEDAHGSASYRKRVGAALVARAWTSAVKEARGG